MRGALAASDEIPEKVVDNARTPEAIRAIRNLLFWRRILGSIEPHWSKAIFQAIPEGIAQATAEREQPVGFFGLLRRLSSKDSLRGLAAAIDSLQAFGRHLHSSEGRTPQKYTNRKEPTHYLGWREPGRLGRRQDGGGWNTLRPRRPGIRGLGIGEHESRRFEPVFVDS